MPTAANLVSQLESSRHGEIRFRCLADFDEILHIGRNVAILKPRLLLCSEESSSGRGFRSEKPRKRHARRAHPLQDQTQSCLHSRNSGRTPESPHGRQAAKMLGRESVQRVLRLAFVAATIQQRFTNIMKTGADQKETARTSPQHGRQFAALQRLHLDSPCGLGLQLHPRLHWKAGLQ
eukprot:SAG31_NODE_3386_length_4331_cov_2.421786_4_plen_178_part_00